jgi:hypothetical protein
MADSGHNAFLIENRRPDTGDQAAGFKMALAKHRHGCMEGVGSLFWLGVLQMVEGIKLIGRSPTSAGRFRRASCNLQG